MFFHEPTLEKNTVWHRTKIHTDLESGFNSIDYLDSVAAAFVNAFSLYAKTGLTATAKISGLGRRTRALYN